MDLKDFVADSLTQIIEGIKKAQEATAKTGAWISPAGSNITPRKETPIVQTAEGEGYLHEVRFDVAITVSDEQKAGAGAGLRVFGAKLGAEGNVAYQNAAVSRIQFAIPVVWPGQADEELEKRLSEKRRQQDAAMRGASNPKSWGR